MFTSNVTILDGSTFLVSGPNGDINAAPDQPQGLFFKDTRHLSKWQLTIKGIPLDVLSTDSLEYTSPSTSAFRRPGPYTRTRRSPLCAGASSATALSKT